MGETAPFADHHALALDGAVASGRAELTAGGYEFDHGVSVPDGNALRDAPVGFA